MPFSYESSRILIRDLGAFDCTVELTELAARDLETRATDASPDAETFITRLARTHNLHVKAMPLRQFKTRRRQYYVVQVHESAERFLDAFRDEFRLLHPTKSWLRQSEADRKRVGKEDLCREVLRNVAAVQAPTIGVEFDCIDYYRLMRNHVVHAIEVKSQALRSREAQLPALKAASKQLYETERPNRRFTFDAPNPLETITFDDFRWFSRCLKGFATKISSAAAPNLLDLVDRLRAEVADSTTDAGRAYSRFAGNPRRQRGMLARLLATRYGLTQKEAENIL